MATLRQPAEPAGVGGQTLATLVVTLGGTALAVGAGLVLARELGAQGYGAYAWALAVTGGLAVPAVAGLDLLLLREVALLGTRHDWPMLRGMWRRARAVSLACGLALAAAAALLTLTFGASLPDGLLAPLLVALVLVPLLARGTLQQAVAQGLRRPVAGLAAWSLLRQLIVLAGAVAFALAGGLTPRLAVVLAIAGALAAYVACAWTLRRLVPAGDAAAVPEGWVRRARPLAVMSSVTVVDAQLGLVVVGVLDGPRAAGLLAAAIQMTVGFVLVRNAAARPLLPLIAVLQERGLRSRLQSELTRATRWVVLATAAGAIAICLLATPLLALFGPGFGDARTALALLCAGHAVNAWVAFNGTVLTAGAHAGAAARAAAAAMLVNTVLLVILVPAWGIEGAAAAWLASVTARNVLYRRIVHRALGRRTRAL